MNLNDIKHLKLSQAILIFLLFIIFTPKILYANLDKSKDILIKNFKLIPQDISKISLYPFKNPNNTLKFFGLSIGLISIDSITTTFIQKNLNPITKWGWYDINLLPLITGEQEYLLFGITGLYGYSLLFGDNKGQEAFWLSIKAYAYSLAYSQIILKTAFARIRPAPDLTSSNFSKDVYTSDPLAFFFFHTPYIESNSYGTAFPSFHFTFFFSIAKVFQRVYDNWLIPYTGAALFLIPNFDSHHHWVSDMVAGAIIGTLIGDIVADNYYGKNDEDFLIKNTVNSGFSFMPLVGGGVVGGKVGFRF